MRFELSASIFILLSNLIILNAQNSQSSKEKLLKLYEETSEETDKRSSNKNGGILIPYRFGKRDYDMDYDSSDELDKRARSKSLPEIPYRFGKRENSKNGNSVPIQFLRFGKRKQIGDFSEDELLDFLQSQERDKRRLMSHRLMPFRYG